MASSRFRSRLPRVRDRSRHWRGHRVARPGDEGKGRYASFKSAGLRSEPRFTAQNIRQEGQRKDMKDRGWSCISSGTRRMVLTLPTSSKPHRPLLKPKPRPNPAGIKMQRLSCIELDQLLLDSGTIHFSDQSTAKAYQNRFDNVRVNGKSLTNKPSEKATIESSSIRRPKNESATVRVSNLPPSVDD